MRSLSLAIRLPTFRGSYECRCGICGRRYGPLSISPFRGSAIATFTGRQHRFCGSPHRHRHFMDLPRQRRFDGSLHRRMRGSVNADFFCHRIANFVGPLLFLCFDQTSSPSCSFPLAYKPELHHGRADPMTACLHRVFSSAIAVLWLGRGTFPEVYPGSCTVADARHVKFRRSLLATS